MIFSAHFPFEPRGKGRPRLGRNATYTDAKTREFERLVAAIARCEMVGPPVDGPVAVEIYCHFGMPKSWSRTRRAERDGRPHTSKPDADNIAKSVCDALEGIVFWKDQQVSALKVEKRWLDRPGFRVTVSRVE